jgi:anaerobic selenocysteine-containing dehydrogenase
MVDSIEIKRSQCFWCHDKCRVALHIRNGRLEKQTADITPVNRVYKDETSYEVELLKRRVTACSRARNAAEWYYHPDRLKFPKKRTGERGEGKWEQISWDQALDEIAAKLADIKAKYGAEAVATSSGTGRTDDVFRSRFFHLFGSPTMIGQGHPCFGPNYSACGLIVGWPVIGGLKAPGVTKCIMMLGQNPEQSFRGSWLRILDELKRGCKLIVVDPRKTPPASKADIWLQPRPGTDTALYLSMINVIIEEELYDKEFVEKWCYGFDKFRERAREYPAEKVQEISWVPADKIRAAARLYATTRPASIVAGMGLEQLNNCTEAMLCRFIFPALTGCYDTPGSERLGGVHPEVITDYEIGLSHWVSPEIKAKQIGADRFKLLAYPGFDVINETARRKMGREHMCFAHDPMVYRAMVSGKPYPVRAMITLSSNPLVTIGDTKVVYKGIKSLDLYVVSDYWMTPCAELADYVLPAAMWLERPQIYNGYEVRPEVNLCEAVMPAKVEGQWDRKNDFEFWRELGIRLGQEKDWPWKTLEEAFSYKFKNFGKTFEQLVAEGGFIPDSQGFRKYEKEGFGTPTGKFEFYSKKLEKLGYEPMPQYYEPRESPISSPEVAKEYPLILITGGRHLPFFHSEHRQIESLRKEHPDPIVQINPKTAVELGIEDGDWTWIETKRGRVRQRCKYFEGIDPRVVHAEHGWWFPELPGEEPWLHGVWESNINVVTEDHPDHCSPILGGWPLRTGLCKVYKAKTY